MMAEQYDGKEDFTGRDRMVRNTIVSWLSQLALIFSGFVMPRLMDETIGQAALGIWDFCWSFVNYLNLLSLGIGSSINRYVARYRTRSEWDKLNTLVSTTVVVQGLLGATVFAATVSISYSLPAFFAESLGRNLASAQAVVLLLGSVLAVQMTLDFSRGLITGHHRWDIHNSIHAGASLVSLAVMTVVLLSGGDIVDIALVYFVVMVLAELFRLFVARRISRGLRISPRLASFDMVKMIVAYGAKSILIYIPQMALIQTMNVVIVSTLGPAMLAVFARPLALIRHLTAMVNKFTLILTPMVGSLQSSGDMDGLRNLFINSARFSFAITMPAVAVLAVMGDLILQIWMGEGYSHRSLIVVLSAGFLLVIAQDCMIRTLMGIDAHGRMGLYMIVVATVSALVEYLVYPAVSSNWSLTTAAVFLVVPMVLVYGIVLPLYTCSRLEIPMAVYLRESMGIPFSCNVPFVVLLMVARDLGESNWILGVAFLLAGGALLMTTYYRYLLTDELRDRVLISVRKSR